MATMKLSELVTPNPCNAAMAQRNWDGVRTALQKLDEILVINVDDVTNEITYDIENITNLTMEGDLNVGGDTFVDGDVNVTQDVNVTGDVNVTQNVTITGTLDVTGDVTFVTVYATSVNSTYATIDYLTSVSIFTHSITACHYYDCDGNELCPPICGIGSGSGGTPGACCCPGVDIPTTLTATISNKTGDCSCLPATVTLNYLGSDPGGGLAGQWYGSYAECSSCAIDFKCITNDDGCEWQLGPSSCAASATLVSSSCNPFEMVFDVNNGVGGALNCTGTYRVTITE